MNTDFINGADCGKLIYGFYRHSCSGCAGSAGSATAAGRRQYLEQSPHNGADFRHYVFLMIRPQQKKQKEHEEMLSRVKAGDKVMTTGGIYGTVVRVSYDKVTLEIAERVHVEFAQGAIANIITAEKALEKKEDK